MRTIDRKLTLNLIVIFNSFTDISFLKYIAKIFCTSCYFQKSYMNRNNKDTTLDTILYIDQNVSQVCQPQLSKIWRVCIFLLKKLGDISLNRDILKSPPPNQKKRKSRLFQYVNFLINRSFWWCFRFIGYLMPAYSFSSRLHKKYAIWWRVAENGIFPKSISSVLKKDMI